MAKGKNTQKAVKKKSEKTLKEKRSEKKEKKSKRWWDYDSLIRWFYFAW